MAIQEDRHAALEGYFAEERPEMRRFIPRHARRVLDCGCGEGAFSRWMQQELGAEVWGIEQDPEAGEQASQVLHRLLAGDVCELAPSLPDGYFDCIVFNDVLEHIMEPGAVLEAVKRKLAPDGVVVASIPNMRFFHVLFAYAFRGEWQYTARGICDRTHVRFFTRRSMAELFREAGYAVEVQEGINGIVFWKFALVNALTLGALWDTRYKQFACVARPI